MLKFSFITIFLNIKFIKILKFFSFFFSLLKLETLLFFLTTHKINRLITNHFNTINDFLIEIENHNIIIFLKSNFNDELIKINTI